MVLGALLIVVADTSLSYLTAMRLYAVGSWSDLVYMLGHVLIAFGACIARDLSLESSYCAPLAP